MSLSKYEIVLKVVESGSLTKAGEALGLSQSAISHAVSGLEQELDLKLLHRGRAGIVVTHEGARLLDYMRAMLDLQKKLLQEADLIKGLATGIVTIGTFTSVSIHWLPQILQSFQTQYPLIEVRLLDGDYQEIEGWIAAGLVDFGFVNMPTDQRMEQMELHKDELLCVLPNDHRLCVEEMVTAEQIRNEAFIMPAKGCDRDLHRWLHEQGGSVRTRFELEDDHAIMAMVQKGLGISILPGTILNALPEGLAVRPLAPQAYRTIGLAAKSWKKGSPAARRAISFIRSTFCMEEEEHTP